MTQDAVSVDMRDHTMRRRRPLARLLGWLTGLPSEQQRPHWQRWTARALVTLIVAYFFLYGPGLRVWSSPPGFDKLANGTIAVYYQPGMTAEAELVAASTIEAERDVLAFWGRPSESGFDFPVDVYLCRSPRRYWHLTMNRGRGSASGNDLLIPASYPQADRIGNIRHELAHLFVVHELGWLRSRLHTPSWLDEGIATSLQGGEWSHRDALARLAARTRELAPLTTTSSTLRWRGAVNGGGERARVQYAYARAFAEDLIDRFGRHAVLDFLIEATRRGDHLAAFAQAFGAPLEQKERQWIDNATRRGLLPADLELVDRGLPADLLVKLAILAAALLFSALWLTRQAGRFVRATARLRLRTRR
jgi:hypothetical protein